MFPQHTAVSNLAVMTPSLGQGARSQDTDDALNTVECSPWGQGSRK